LKNKIKKMDLKDSLQKVKLKSRPRGRANPKEYRASVTDEG